MASTAKKRKKTGNRKSILDYQIITDTYKRNNYLNGATNSLIAILISSINLFGLTLLKYTITSPFEVFAISSILTLFLIVILNLIRSTEGLWQILIMLIYLSTIASSPELVFVSIVLLIATLLFPAIYYLLKLPKLKW